MKGRTLGLQYEGPFIHLDMDEIEWMLLNLEIPGFISSRRVAVVAR